jgi:hypothetical protein
MDAASHAAIHNGKRDCFEFQQSLS